MRIDLNSEKLITYIKAALIAILVVTEVVVCAQTIGRYAGAQLAISLVIVMACCIALVAAEAFNSFVVKNFALKMVFLGIDLALLLVICTFTGNSLLSTMYCVVLTQIYISIPKFKDKLIIFSVSCALYTMSFVIGWVLMNRGATLYDSAVEISSGALFGLLIIAVDFIIVQFLLKFYRTNRELTSALKEADESRAALQVAYEQLRETAVYEERNRIAKDIHDTAGHSMTTVIMQTEAAKLLIDNDPAEAKNRIISANLQARNALEQMRESVHLLAGRSSSMTLKGELEEIIAQTVDGTDVKARFDIDDAAADDGVRRFLCNSLKECLANGIRHGKATAFYVEFKGTENGLRLYVSDNGSGTDGKPQPGFGLKSMSERACALGGTCTFGGEKDEGFEVTITLPAPVKGDGAESTDNPVKTDNLVNAAGPEKKQ